MRLENETVWLTIEQMATLFGKARSTINEHILNAFQEGELNEKESMRKIGNSDISTKPTNYYTLGPPKCKAQDRGLKTTCQSYCKYTTTLERIFLYL